MTRRTGSLTLLACLAVIFCLALPSFAQQSPVVTRGPILIQETHHDTGPLLREVEPLLPEFSLPTQHEVENFTHPNPKWSKAIIRDLATQNAENGPKLDTPTPNVEFEGLGQTDQFFCNCAPPDNDGAPGVTNQYTQYVNLFYKVSDKSGNKILGPLPGNSFWSGFGGACQSNNSGDPIIRFDAAAGRWVASQFAIIINNPMFECVAVSQTSDATGAYNRYAFQINAFPDYPKMGVWPDAYYFTFNNFNESGSAYVGADACAVDRTKMLAGQAATMVCFQQDANQYGELPADLDGATPPASGTPNFVMELDPVSTSQLDMFKFHVDFAVPSNSTFTGPTLVNVTAFNPLCINFFRTQCVPQPGTGQVLESLGDRMMYRLVYRNFGDHTVLLASHSVLASGNQGGVRWYEMRNPETGPTVFQQGTFAPDAQWRFMPAIAMDKNQDIAVGYTRTGTGTGQFPSLVYAGRIPSDSAGTLETEQVLKAGAGSQTGGLARWGDYSSMTIDPADDCTFWFTEEYLAANGAFNWHTAVGSFNFPGCGSQGQPAVTLKPKSLGFPKTILGTSSKPLNVKLTNSGNANLLINSIASSGDFTQTNNCPIAPNPLAPAAFCTITVTFTPTALNKRTGTITITDNAPNTPQTVPLSGVGTIVTFLPTSMNFGKVTVGQHSSPMTATLTNKSTTTPVIISNVTITGINKTEFSITNNTCTGTINPLGTCQVTVVATPGAVGARHGALNVFHNGGGSPSISSMVVTGQ